MKMVKTFTKTQHQHVMPPEKGRKERKGKEMHTANQLGKLAGPAEGRPPDGLGCAGGQGERRPDGGRDKAQRDPSPPCVSLQCPRKLRGQFPVTSRTPSPRAGKRRKKDLTPQQRLWSVLKNARRWVVTSERATPPQRRTMPVPPLTYLHRGQRASLMEVENRHEKTRPGNDQSRTCRTTPSHTHTRQQHLGAGDTAHYAS